MTLTGTRKRSEAAKARAKEKYRAKRKFTRQVMKNIIACDSAFCSEVKVMHVKPVNPIGIGPVFVMH